jgi:hypothetical protein
MSAYCTKEDFRALAAQAPTGAAADSLFDRLCAAASRAFDRACEAEDDFFAVAAGSASERTFYGDGSDFLSLPPFVGASVSAVELPEGYDELEAGDYYEAREARNFYLVRQYGTSRLSLQDAGAWFSQGIIPLWPVGPFDLVTNNFRSLARGAGWPRGVAVIVTARWGWTPVPPEVVQATVEIALHLWRNSDPVWMQQANVPVTPQSLPATAQMVADKYRERRPLVFA